MISLSYRGDDRFTRYGIRHFIKKSGIAIEPEPSAESRICIGYGDREQGTFHIHIRENTIKDSLAGSICTEDEEMPVFEIPTNTGEKGRVLAWFRNGGSCYPCITSFEGGIAIGFDLFREVGYLLSGHLDRIWPALDDAQKDRIAQSPIVDFHEDLMVRCIRIGCEQLNLPLAWKAYWPDRRRFAVCLTHDVDETRKTYQWITRPVRFLRSGDFQGIRNQLASLVQKIKGKEPYWTFPDIMQIEREFGVSSTFFFLKETARTELLSPESWHHWARTRSLDDPEMKVMMLALEAAGSEVGLHGSFYSYRNPELLEHEKEDLEKLTGRQIRGIRQHHLNLEIPLTWTIHQALHLSYDTSLGFKDRIGFRSGTCFPFHPIAGEDELDLLEIPLALMDITIPMNSDGWAACQRIIDAVEKRQGVLTLLWHPPVFNELEYPHAREMYQRILALCRDRGAWITNSRDISDWWTRREETRFTMGRDGQALKIAADTPDPRQYIELWIPDGKEVHLDPGGVGIFIHGSGPQGDRDGARPETRGT